MVTATKRKVGKYIFYNGGGGQIIIEGWEWIAFIYMEWKQKKNKITDTSVI